MKILSTKKVASAIATGALLMNAFATTAFATTTVQVTGNGDSSNNTANVSNNQSTTVVQSNTANISNNVHSSANSGSNDANRNTGGDVKIDTGNATSLTDVSTAVNLNVADLSNCNCNNDTKVVISGNGVDSRNKVDVKSTKNSGTDIFQNNDAYISNDVSSKANTGKNDANSNTGSVSGHDPIIIMTGSAVAESNVSNLANANIAKVGSSSDKHGSGDTALILGNGDSSKNTIRLLNDHSTTIVQDNDAHIWNDVEANANSGKNHANRNTGADVTIDTGFAGAKVTVDNAVNFNKAVVDCDCLLGGDTEIKIAGNGVDSWNKVTDHHDGDLNVFQGGNEKEAGNFAWLWNDANADAVSGKNHANSNTGAFLGDDPTVILTGNAVNQTDVNNEGNVNIFSNGGTFSPLPHPSDFVFNFDMGGLWGWWHGV